jgi:serine/threonine protein phosphatase 1
MVVIGDVHGQRDSLATLLKRLETRTDVSARWVVFIGDFLDRGADPQGALQLVLNFMAEHPKVTAVMGNHDLAIAGALGLVKTPAQLHWDKRYMSSYDPRTTFSSYGVAYGDLAALKQAMPDEHKHFIAGLPWCVEHPDYLIVHAGLQPDRPYGEQLPDLRERDFSHNRPPWLCDRRLDDSPLPTDCDVTVISGHKRKSEVVFGDRRILLDTSGGSGGTLSAVLFPEREVVTS